MHITSKPDPAADQRVQTLWQQAIEIGRQARQAEATAQQEAPREQPDQSRSPRP